MGTSLWWVFDLVAFLIVLHVIISNTKRGVSKVIIMCIGYIIVTLAASLLSAAAAPNLYSSVASQTNITALETANRQTDLKGAFTKTLNDRKYGYDFDAKYVEKCLLASVDPDTPFDKALFDHAKLMTGDDVDTFEHFQQVLMDSFVAEYGAHLGERLPKYVRMDFERSCENNPQKMYEITAILYDPSKTSLNRAEVLEHMLCEKPTQEILQIFLYFIIFSILMVLVAVISAIASKNIFFNLGKVSEHFFGGVLGLFEAASFMVLMTLLVRMIIMLSGNTMKILNEETVNSSMLFSFLYRNISKLL